MSRNDGKTTLCYMVGSLSLDEEPEYSGWWSYDDPADDEPEEMWDFHYEQVDQTHDRDGTVTTTFRGTFNHKDGVAKDEFVLHVDTISGVYFEGRGESDFGEYTIVGEITDAELDSAGLSLRKLV